LTARATAKSLVTLRLLYWAALAAIAWPTLLSGSGQGQGASEQATGLFVPVPVAIPSAVSPQPGGRRSRFVEVDFTGLGGRYGAGPAHGRLDPTLFPGESYAAVLDRVETTYAGRSWIGHVDGIPLSDVWLTVVRGALAGSISWPGGHSYRVSPAHEGLHTISEVDAGAPIQDLTVTPPFDALEADNALDRISAAAVADDPSARATPSMSWSSTVRSFAKRMAAKRAASSMSVRTARDWRTRPDPFATVWRAEGKAKGHRPRPRPPPTRERTRGKAPFRSRRLFPTARPPVSTRGTRSVRST